MSFVSMIRVVLVAMAFGPPSAAAAEEKLRHDLEMSLDPAASRIEVTDRIEVSGHEALALNLAPGLELTSALIDGEAATPVSDQGVLWIRLPEAGESLVELAYQGVIEGDGGQGGLAPMLSADGGFLPYGLGWLANAGAEDDAVTYELTVRAPAPYKAVATGALIEETEEDGAYRAVFATVRPSEPPSVFAGAFRIDERDHEGIRLRTYFPEDQQPLSEIYLDQAASYIDLFEDRIGDYPYDGFAMIAGPLPVGLGFPGLTFFSSRILPMPFMQTRSLAHEILHNWWANGVFVDYREGNWSEGLTTYMADYALAEADGPDQALEMRLGWLRDYSALPEERDQPLAAFRSKGHDADQVIGYNKVAMVLHMLRHEIGEPAFDSGIKGFWSDFKFRTAGWSDIQASFEKASGRDLDAFFGPWIAAKGALRLTLDNAEVSEGEGGFALALGVTSDRDDYDLLIPVRIETEAGIKEADLRLRNGVGEAVIETEAKPLSVGIDQGRDLFRHLAADEAPPILRDVTLDQDALTVIAVDGNDEARKIAEELAGRVLDTGVRPAGLDDEAIAKAPLMLIGLADHMEGALAKAGLEGVPEDLADRGTARSWVANRGDAPPVLVVEADSEDALAALLRPLPHYSRNSFLVFEGRKMVRKGVWTAGDNALTRRFD